MLILRGHHFLTRQSCFVPYSVENYEVYEATPVANKLSGIWLFNSYVNLPSGEIIQNISFKSNGVEYTIIKLTEEGIIYENLQTGVFAYVNGTWRDENLRTIEFANIQDAEENFWTEFTANAVWQLMLMSGAKIDTTSFSVYDTISLSRLKEDYYITEIAPTLEVEFDVKITDIRAISSWSETDPRFEYYDSNEEDEYTTRQTIASNYLFDTESQDFDYKNGLTFKSVLSILPNDIICDLSVISNKTLVQKNSWHLSPALINKIYPYKITISNTTVNTYDLAVKFINKLTIYFAQNHKFSLKRGNFGTPADAIKVEMVAKTVKLLYNETVRKLKIDRESFSLINSNAEGEDTFSIDENQFIRAETRYDGVKGATKTFYNKTLTDYQNGKETATLRCSVGEYYDENGTLAISTKTADKMMFEHYDKVVPMVRSGRRKELAMSYTADGLAKVFEVVGVRVFFDGAVWQELTLRESGEGIDIGRTTYTTIANNAGGLTYKITSNEIVTEENSARGITYIIGD